MSTTAFLALIVLGAVVAVVFTLRLRRTAGSTAEEPAPSGPSGPLEHPVPPSAPAPTTFWTSPVWNAIGVASGAVGAVVGVIGLFR
jgi:hypothetical protein